MRCNKVLNVMSVSRVLIIYAIKLRFVNEQIPFMEIYKKQIVKQTFCRIRCFYLLTNTANHTIISYVSKPFNPCFADHTRKPVSSQKGVNDRKMCRTCNILLTFFVDLINNYFKMKF